MFYVKKEIANMGVIKTNITDENVYTTCPACGVEHQINLVETIQNGDFCLFATAVYCIQCSAKKIITKRIKVNRIKKGGSL